MPELPEVETMCRGIRSIVGRRIAAIGRTRCAKQPISVQPAAAVLRRRAVGRRIEAVERLGKRVVLRLAGGAALVFEPRMTGLVLLTDPPTTEHLRFSVELDDGRRVLFWDRRGLATVRLLTADESAAGYPVERLGPDALAVDAAEFGRRLGAGRRAVKPALLDQRVVAGIGNLYASEMLFAARIDPRRRASSLSAVELRRLHAAMRKILLAAIRYEGSTLADGTYRNALNRAGGYQNHHRVYDREGEPCPACRRNIVRRIVQAQRATFFCPHCQRSRSPR